jgi:hypothetical protein
MPSLEQHQEIQHPTLPLPLYFDYAAIFLWAISGALLVATRGYAILGILTVALVSSTAVTAQHFNRPQLGKRLSPKKAYVCSRRTVANKGIDAWPGMKPPNSSKLRPR